ncbi:MAG: hypothetical protein RR745_04905 [Bacilli bacterium]
MEVYWINSREIKLTIEDKKEILTPDQIIVKYGENIELMTKITELLKKPKNEVMVVYDKILNESTYDEKYAIREKINDGKMKLDAYEIYIKNIMRTKKDKRGTCQAFAMRISDELDMIGIENYIIVSDYPDFKHYANLYIMQESLLVADIASDLIDKEIRKDEGEEEYFEPASNQIPLIDYLYDNDITYVIEKIEDNNKKIEELNKKPIKSFVINYELSHDLIN